MDIAIQYFDSPFGKIILGAYNKQLVLCDWADRTNRAAIDERISKGLKSIYREEESEITLQAKSQIEEYATGKRLSFELDFRMVGTDFQKSVWEQLMRIPYGTTLSYKSLADKMNNPKAIRAIASANGANALSLIIPCHRVIGSDNSMTGYAGGITAKEELLKLEGILLNKQLNLF